MNKIAEVERLYDYSKLQFVLHLLYQVEDLLKTLHDLGIECTIVTNFKQETIKFIIDLTECDAIQVRCLKALVVKESVYEIKFV